MSLLGKTIRWCLGADLQRMIANGSDPMKRVLVDFALGLLAMDVRMLISEPMSRGEFSKMLARARQEGRI